MPSKQDARVSGSVCALNQTSQTSKSGGEIVNMWLAGLGSSPTAVNDQGGRVTLRYNKEEPDFDQRFSFPLALYQLRESNTASSRPHAESSPEDRSCAHRSLPSWVTARPTAATCTGHSVPSPPPCRPCRACHHPVTTQHANRSSRFFGRPLSGCNQPVQRCRSMVLLIGSGPANQPSVLSH